MNDKLGSILKKAIVFHRSKILSKHLHGRLRKVNEKPVRIADNPAQGCTKDLSNTRLKCYCFTNTFSRSAVHCTSFTSIKCRRILQALTDRVALQCWPPTSDYGVLAYENRPRSLMGFYASAGVRKTRPAHISIFMNFYYPFGTKQ
jgi:hypothetical protein